MDGNSVREALDKSFTYWLNILSVSLKEDGVRLDEANLLDALERLLSVSLEGADCEWEEGSLHEAISSYWNNTLKRDVEGIMLNGWKAVLKGAEHTESYKGLRCDLLPVRFVAGHYFWDIIGMRDQLAYDMKKISNDNKAYQDAKQFLKKEDSRFGEMLIRKYNQLNRDEKELKRALLSKWSWGFEAHKKGYKTCFSYVKNL